MNGRTVSEILDEEENMTFGERVLDYLLDYKTLKIVNINDKNVGLLNRVIQLAILGYIIGFVIIHEKGYQRFSPYNSVTTAKVKGVISTLGYTKDDFLSSIVDPEAYRRVWDTTDLVVPPSEPDAFFITTNLIITRQHAKRCPEMLMKDTACGDESDCESGRTLLFGHGSQTGQCVPTAHSTANRTVCEIDGWCPVEYDEGPLKSNRALLDGVQTFTVLLKNYIEFPYFQIKLRNIPDNQNRSYLQNCLYDQETDPHCPIFRLSQIINATGNSFETIAVKGGIVRIVITWNCNFDWPPGYCIPRYEFSRLDDSRAQLGRGWNFRHAHYHNATHRTLYKAYGIAFRVAVSARGGKFSLEPLAVNLGSGLGLLVVAKVVCDFVVMNCHKNRKHYTRQAILQVYDTQETRSAGQKLTPAACGRQKYSSTS